MSPSIRLSSTMKARSPHANKYTHTYTHVPYTCKHKYACTCIPHTYIKVKKVLLSIHLEEMHLHILQIVWLSPCLDGVLGLSGPTSCGRYQVPVAFPLGDMFI